MSTSFGENQKEKNYLERPTNNWVIRSLLLKKNARFNAVKFNFFFFIIIFKEFLLITFWRDIRSFVIDYVKDKFEPKF